MWCYKWLTLCDPVWPEEPLLYGGHNTDTWMNNLAYSCPCVTVTNLSVLFGLLPSIYLALSQGPLWYQYLPLAQGRIYTSQIWGLKTRTAAGGGEDLTVAADPRLCSHRSRAKCPPDQCLERQPGLSHPEHLKQQSDTALPLHCCHSMPTFCLSAPI